MTEVFQPYAKDRTMPRSEALRQGMLALTEKAKGDTLFCPPVCLASFLLGGGRNWRNKMRPIVAIMVHILCRG